MEKRITEFYARHEPEKLSSGKVSPEIVDFALSRGEAALNAKLQEKYGADLGTEARRASYRANPSTGENVMAAKITDGAALDQIL